MIIGIGTDIIEIKRVTKAIQSTRFLQRCFSEQEILQIEKKGAQTAAGYFAAKEAVAKALGSGFSGFLPCCIEVQNDGKGKPIILLHEKAKAVADELCITNVHVTISHCTDFAIAYAVAEKLDMR